MTTALVLGLSACASGVTGHGELGSGAVPDHSSSPAEHTSSASSPAAPQSTAAAGPGAGDFAHVSYTIPKGYTAVGGFQLIDPLEHNFRVYWVTPATRTDGSAGLIAIAIYSLPKGVDVSTAAKQRARVQYYDRRLKDRIITPLRVGTLAERPAFSDFVQQPPNFFVYNYYTFSSTQVLVYTCQEGASATNGAFLDSCDTMLDTLRTS